MPACFVGNLSVKVLLDPQKNEKFLKISMVFITTWKLFKAYFEGWKESVGAWIYLPTNLESFQTSMGINLSGKVCAVKRFFEGKA